MAVAALEVASLMQTWKTLAKKTLLEHGSFLRVEAHEVLLPNGEVIPDWGWVVTPDFAMIVAVTPEHKILCFRQTKYAAKGVGLAPPGGYLEEGEDPLEAAKRELLEETGFTSAAWSSLGSYAVDGNRGAGTAHFFLAREAVKVTEPDADDLEEQELLFLSPVEVRMALEQGKVKVLPWVAALSLALLKLET